MKLVEVYWSAILHGYVVEVENLLEFPVLLRAQEIDFAGMIAISAGDEFLQPRPKKGQRSGPGAISHPALHCRCANNEPSIRRNQLCLFWKS